ncbi:hypothetical protein CLU79DRAFT_837179 [Phycomyces nitens]|nr:hypothetical protein CLU79DRAFT_837179 [Phycomyces nitens]
MNSLPNPIPPRESLGSETVKDAPVSPMPVGIERMEALKNLGATFEEGHRRVSKIATPTEEDVVPSFVDTKQVQQMARLSKHSDFPFTSTIPTSR